MMDRPCDDRPTPRVAERPAALAHSCEKLHRASSHRSPIVAHRKSGKTHESFGSCRRARAHRRASQRRASASSTHPVGRCAAARIALRASQRGHGLTAVLHSHEDPATRIGAPPGERRSPAAARGCRRAVRRTGPGGGRRRRLGADGQPDHRRGLDEILCAAERHGICEFRADVLTSNDRMLRLLAHHADVTQRTTRQRVTEMFFRHRALAATDHR